MRYPILSFSLAILLWILLILLTWKILQTNHEILPATLDIDAAMIEQEAAQKKSAEISAPEKSPSKNIEKKEAVNSSSKNSKIVAVISRPLPQIPDELRLEAFNSYAIARFYINADGSANVELIKPCQNPLLNRLLLQSLKKWKFEESAAPSTQDIKVNFKVE